MRTVSKKKVEENLPEVRPHFICSVPRVFEKVYAGVLAKAEAGSPLKKKIFRWAVGVGKEVSRLKQAGKPVPRSARVRRWPAVCAAAWLCACSTGPG